MVKIAWERLLVSFIFVDAVTLRVYTEKLPITLQQEEIDLIVIASNADAVILHCALNYNYAVTYLSFQGSSVPPHSGSPPLGALKDLEDGLNLTAMEVCEYVHNV